MGKNRHTSKREEKRRKKIASRRSVASKYLDATRADSDFYPIERENYSVLKFAGLRKANEHAIATKKNRALHEWVIDAQEQTNVFPIAGAFVHNNREIRIVVAVVDPETSKTERGFIDVDFEVFDEIEVRNWKPLMGLKSKNDKKIRLMSRHSA